MQLKNLMDIVIASDRTDWHAITCWGAAAGPSYRDRFDSVGLNEMESHVILRDSHSMVCVYKPDVHITIAFGLYHRKKYSAAWCNQFTDPEANSSFVDVFYNAALVFRTFYVSVDGGRGKLPCPKTDQDLTVPHGYATFIQMIDRMEGGSEFDEFFHIAGFQLVDDPWPDLSN